MANLRHYLLIFFVHFLYTKGLAQSARRNGGNADQFDVVEPGTEEFRARRRGACPTHYRTYDGSCTNEVEKIWGSAGTPHFSYIYGRSSKFPTGQDLPSPRLISNVLCNQAEDIYNDRNLSELVVFFGQFVDHTLVVTASNKSESMPISIPKNDPIFANFTDGVLPFDRSVRGIVMNENDIERPINSLSSALDLASVYSSDNGRIPSLRTYKHGLLKTSEGNMLPFNIAGLVNAPTKEAKFYLAGDHRANEHPVLTSLHTLFVREHNRLCLQLKEKFPFWNDFRLFQTARKINIAQFQKIVYEEWFPSLTGRRLPYYRGYQRNINPTLSSTFSTAAFRLGHTLVGNFISRRGVNNSELSPFPMNKMFFRSSAVMEQGIEPFLRGSMNQVAQEVDTLVMPSLRNFLFTGIPQESGFDLIAMNIQRGRDHALPTYNELRVLFGRSPARKFRHITKNLALQSRLQSVYGTTDRVEAWIGLLSEDHSRSSSMGPTLLRILRREFSRLRSGDRFFFRRWNLFSRSFWRKYPEIRETLFGQNVMKRIILLNTNITEEEIGQSIWKSKPHM